MTDEPRSTLGDALNRAGVGDSGWGGRWADRMISAICPVCSRDQALPTLPTTYPVEQAVHYRCQNDDELLIAVNDREVVPPGATPFYFAAVPNIDVQMVMAFGRIMLHVNGQTLQLGQR